MSESEATLNTIFSLDAGELPTAIATAVKSSDASSALQGQILQHAAKVDWGSIFAAIAEQVTTLLDVSLGEVMVTGWNKYKLLADCRDEEKYSPDDSVLITLSKHSFSSEHKPSIEVMVNDQPAAEIPFTITLTLKLEGAILKVQDKKIREIRFGEVGGEGVIKSGEFEIAKRKIDSKTIPGSISLDPGIEIPAVYDSER